MLNKNIIRRISIKLQHLCKCLVLTVTAVWVLSAAANSIIPAFHAMPVGKLLFKLILSLWFLNPVFSHEMDYCEIIVRFIIYKLFQVSFPGYYLISTGATTSTIYMYFYLSNFHRVSVSN